MSYRLLPSRLLTGPSAERAWRLLAVVLMAVVAGLALSPSPPHIADTGWDKLNHVLAFVALAFCGGLGFPGAWSRAALVAAALVAYGGAIELLQLMVATRMADWADLLADVIGTGLGLALADLLRRLCSSSGTHAQALAAEASGHSGMGPGGS